ncbi:MAG: hypothetical protein R3301_10205 [Saprospiraceae bacterium]|nr:hypothetical protein [Saprospiraceae bacterium]
MTDKELDHIIKRLLENYQPETDLSGWAQFEERLDSEMLEDTLFDNSIRASLGAYEAGGPGDWARMEEALAHEEAAFDQEVKEKVEAFEAPYDPDSWPVLKEKISEDERLRRRIMATKILELVAILIAFVTVYNVFPTIQQAVQERMDDRMEHLTPAQEPQETYEASAQLSAGLIPTTSATATTTHQTPASADRSDNATQNASRQPEPAASIAQLAGIASHQPPDDLQVDPSVTPEVPGASTLIASQDQPLAEPVTDPGETVEDVPADDANAHATFASLDQLETGTSLVTSARRSIPDLGISTAVLDRRGLRFSISASTEINQLYIPADHFYSLGKQVSFTEKDMTAIGYSAGASVLFDRDVFTFETGLHYSQKSYNPNRILHIGETFDVRTLDFKNISLHVISVPLQVHWNFDRKGRTRLYTVAGASMNLIATAHYDLISRNNNRSAAAPQDPSFRRTTQEVERIREHILDDAEFSAKSFLTLNAGFGIERLINHKFSVFLQPTASYQIPFFHISDQNGKHLQYLSAQFGTRIRLK